MASEVIYALRNIKLLVDVKGSCESLRKHVRDIVVGVTPVIKLSPESALPFLGCHGVAGVGRVEKEALELQFADAAEFRAGLKVQIGISLIGIGALDESQFRIEVRSYFSAFNDALQPIRFVGQGGTDVAVPAGIPQGTRASGVGVHNEVPEEDQPRIDTAGLVVGILNISCTLVDSHDANVGVTEQGT